MPDEEGRRLPGDLLLQGGQLQELVVPLPQKMLDGTVPGADGPAELTAYVPGSFPELGEHRLRGR